MIRHVILWQLRDEYDAKAKEQIKAGMKEGLESLYGKIPGLTGISVITEGIDSATADAMLDAEFEDEEALKLYKDHPAHVSVANERVRPFVRTRICMDYEPEDDRPVSMYRVAAEDGMQMAYSEGLAAGRNTQLKNMISRKLRAQKTSAQIAEELGEDIMDVEMLIVQLLERC